MFKKGGDYAAFENALRDVLDRQPARLVTDFQMPTHWHLVISPRKDGDLSEFMRWLTVTHSQRWHSQHGTSGAGPLALPSNRATLVNRALSEAELASLRHCVVRSRPCGSETWMRSTAASLGLESTLRPRGRPLKDEKGGPE